jgi:hypothetical protein
MLALVQFEPIQALVQERGRKAEEGKQRRKGGNTHSEVEEISQCTTAQKHDQAASLQATSVWKLTPRIRSLEIRLVEASAALTARVKQTIASATTHEELRRSNDIDYGFVDELLALASVQLRSVGPGRTQRDRPMHEGRMEWRRPEIAEAKAASVTACVVDTGSPDPTAIRLGATAPDVLVNSRARGQWSMLQVAGGGCLVGERRL